MTDSIFTDFAPPKAPESLYILIQDLWRHSMHQKEHVYRSGAFRALENTCQSIYHGLEGSRLQKPLSKTMPLNVLNRGLRNFFRWNGAPWFGDQTPGVAETAASLHHAFLRPSVHRTYLAPLDRLSLEDYSDGSTQESVSVSFGPNEIVRLGRKEIVRRVPVDALARFGPRYKFPTGELDGFRWLVVNRTEPAGSVERRTWLNLLSTVHHKIGTVELFRSTFPPPVEDALFVMLQILVKDPQDTPWKPFRIPWTFSFTDDFFSDPVVPPDPSLLTRQIVGDEFDQIEVPDQSEIFEFSSRQHDALQQRWNHLETVLERAATNEPNIHPLTRHFFVKALSEHGVDEIISNLSCLEATLQLKRDRSRNALKQRHARLVANEEAALWLNAAYDLRDGYIHSLADPKCRLKSTDLAQTRWIVAMAVRNYLDLATKHPELNRTRLLRQLEC